MRKIKYCRFESFLLQFKTIEYYTSLQIIEVNVEARGLIVPFRRYEHSVRERERKLRRSLLIAHISMAGVALKKCSTVIISSPANDGELYHVAGNTEVLCYLT